MRAKYSGEQRLSRLHCPGYTATERLTELSTALAKSGGVSQSEVERRWPTEISLGRPARPEEFADTVVYLCSERASYIAVHRWTSLEIAGQSIPTDGGYCQGLR
jgi:3-oxoacyl-[acyl-carrier protein] reductase